MKPSDSLVHKALYDIIVRLHWMWYETKLGEPYTTAHTFQVYLRIINDEIGTIYEDIRYPRDLLRARKEELKNLIQYVNKLS